VSSHRVDADAANRPLAQNVRGRHLPEQPLVDDSPQMRAILTIIEKVADTDTTVVVRGESGVGKDLVARAIHIRSARRDDPFVKVNCAAIPPGLLESELFGHEKGAFTGAHRRKPGQFEYATKGTIYLDEIAELPLALQIARRGAREAERKALVEVLERVQGNRVEAARVLKVSYKTLLNKIAEGELTRPSRGRRP